MEISGHQMVAKENQVKDYPETIKKNDPGTYFSKQP